MDPRVAAWWDAVLAGEVGEAHPILGDRISVRVAGGRLLVSGELDRPEDRRRLVKEARAHIGRGIRTVDASRLRVAERSEKPGVLDQTLVAAFPNRATAELARKLVLEHGRADARDEAIVDRAGSARLRALLPAGFVGDAQKRLERGEALVVLRVDETDAFRVRALLEEETRSTWTIATPPEPARRG